MPKRPDDNTFVAPRYVTGGFGWAAWPDPELIHEGSYVYDNNLNANQPGWPGNDDLLLNYAPDHIDDHYFGGWTARDVGVFDYSSAGINVLADAATDSAGITDLTGTPQLLIRGTFHRWGGAENETYRKLIVLTNDETIGVEPDTDDFEILVPLTLSQGRRLIGLNGYYQWEVRVGSTTFAPPAVPGYYGVAIWKMGIVGDFSFAGGGGGTGDNPIPVSHGISNAPSRTVTRVHQGFADAAFPIVLDLDDDDGQLDDGEGSVTAFVQGASPLEVVTFTLGHTADGDLGTIATQTSDANGDVGPFDLYIPATGFAGSHRLTATSPTHGTDTILIYLAGSGVGGTPDPGVDAAPVRIAGSETRWVLQDLMPGGLGSWVMPVNPTTMSNPHVSKPANVRSTTAPRTGAYHVGESSVQVVQWTISGYCPDQTFHEQLVAYGDLNRRIYVIDHRGRAWKCAVAGLDITPRKRQIEEDGSPQDWAADYRIVFDLLDQTFVEVGL